jgi:hypothetical protein
MLATLTDAAVASEINMRNGPLAFWDCEAVMDEGNWTGYWSAVCMAVQFASV